MLRKEAVSKSLFDCLKSLMLIDDLKSFNLVGGTAISLLLGHRKSIDIDLFSNHKVDLLKISRSINNKLGKGLEFNITDNSINTIVNEFRVEIYDNWSIPFRHKPLEIEGIRIATLEDLASFKISAMVGRREKKDYIDLFFLFKHLDPDVVLRDFKKYEPLLSPKSVVFALMEVDTARENKSVMPDMLVDFQWDEIKETFNRAAKNYVKEITSTHQQSPLLRFGESDKGKSSGIKK